MRHYEWKDVTAVSVHRRDSISRRQRRFRNVPEMSSGQRVDLSGALQGASAGLRAASAALVLITASRSPGHLRPRRPRLERWSAQNRASHHTEEATPLGFFKQPSAFKPGNEACSLT